MPRAAPVLALALWPLLLRAGDGKSTLARGKLQLNVTDCGPANLLPTFRALSSSGESIEHVGPALVPQQSGTEVGFFDITCPDDIFENPLPTENARHLPYRRPPAPTQSPWRVSPPAPLPPAVTACWTSTAASASPPASPPSS